MSLGRGGGSDESKGVQKPAGRKDGPIDGASPATVDGSRKQQAHRKQFRSQSSSSVPRDSPASKKQSSGARRAKAPVAPRVEAITSTAAIERSMSYSNAR